MPTIEDIIQQLVDTKLSELDQLWKSHFIVEAFMINFGRENVSVSRCTASLLATVVAAPKDINVCSISLCIIKS
jgi:hypothetical protein